MGNKQTKDPLLEELQTSLLATTLYIVQQQDIKESRNYEEYNGTGLPPGSTGDMLTAALTYMTPPKNQHNPLHQQQFEKKKEAVKLYIDKNILQDRESMEAFLKKAALLMLDGKR